MTSDSECPTYRCKCGKSWISLSSEAEWVYINGKNATCGLCGSSMKKVDSSQSEAPSVVTVKEQLAAIEHERWSDWQKWCHEVLYKELGWSDRLEKVLERWKVQIETPYFELSEKEKQSDRDQVDRYWPLINRLIIGAEENGILKGLYQARYATEPGSGEEQRIDNQIAELSNNLSKGDE